MCNDHCCGDCSCPADQVPDGTTSGQVDRLTDRVRKVEEAVEALILAALRYEDVWTRFASTVGRDRTLNLVIAKSESHMSLLAATRAYRGLFND